MRWLFPLAAVSACTVATGYDASTVFLCGLDGSCPPGFACSEGGRCVRAGELADAGTPDGGSFGPPTGLVAAPASQEVTLGWEAASGALTYNVYRSTATGPLTEKTRIATRVAALLYTDQPLENGTTYFYQVTAQSACCESEGSAETSAKPMTMLPPAATTAPASNVMSNSARLFAYVNPNSASTEAYFEYGTTAAYGYRTANQVVGSSPWSIPVSAVLGSLTGSTTYHFRVVATSQYGTSRGANRSFTTRPSADTTAPTNTTASEFINGGAATTDSDTVVLVLAAADDVGVDGYWASENPATPAPFAPGWITVTPASSYSANVDFQLSPGAGVKTVSVWFRDAAGNVSSGATDTITYVPPPMWRQTGLDRGEIEAIAAAPSDANIVYAATETSTIGWGVYTTADGGDNWIHSYDMWSSRAVAVHPANADVAYAGSVDGVLKTGNRGRTWVVSWSGASQALALAIDPADPNVVYGAFPWGYGVYKSVNGGALFSRALSGIYARCLAIAPSSTGVVYVGTENYDPVPGGVHRTTDGGSNWTRVLTASRVYALAVDPVDPDVVYAGLDGDGISKTTNGGGSWSSMNAGLTHRIVRALAIDPSDRSVVYAGTWEGGVFRSGDAGTSWSAINLGLTNTFVLSLSAASASPTLLYAGTSGSGVFRFEDQPR